MPDASSIWRFGGSLVRTLYTVVMKLFLPRFTTESIDIVEQNESRLVLRSNGRMVVVDTRTRTVRTEPRILAHFDAIQSIDTIHNRASDEEPEAWAVELNLSWYKSVRVGRSTNQAEASIAAMHVSTLTGKQVRAL